MVGRPSGEFPRWNYVKIVWPDCISNLPHIVSDPCQPRWVVRCEHNVWFWSMNKYWTNAKDEKEAYFALWNLFSILKKHDKEVTNG